MDGSTSNNKCHIMSWYCLLLVVLTFAGHTRSESDCPRFCQMFSQTRVQQMWCLADLCPKVGQGLLPNAKRGYRDGLEVVARRKTPPPFSYVEKRDKEIWEGPAPADINH
ncbi:unnamed protein product [Lymnaea stagnalis]|uniref:Uncharacterized protein n=1 Tax=Lymnaea stagnalis TaxID=6523 RepID=A0AAV2HP30_LYMST